MERVQERVRVDASDAELLRAVRDGDPDAYGALYARHADAATRFVQAQRADTGWQPRYSSEKKLWPWLLALVQGDAWPPADDPAPAAASDAAPAPRLLPIQ